MRNWLRSLHAGQVVLLEVIIGLGAVVAVAVVLVADSVSLEAATYLLPSIALLALVGLLAVPWAWLSARR